MQAVLKPQLDMMLPKHIDREFWLKSLSVTLAANETKFSQCDRLSLMTAIMRCAELGTLPNGKQAAIIPYGAKAELQIMVGGLVEVLDKAGIRVHTENVYSNDSFKYIAGDAPAIHHSIDIFKTRGEYKGTYAVFKDKSNGEVIAREFLSSEEMATIQKKSQNSQAWKEFVDEMRKKSAIKRGAKRLSLSPTVEKAVEFDNDVNGFKPEEKVVTPQTAQEPTALLETLGLKKATQIAEPESKDVTPDEDEDPFGDGK